MFTRPPYSCRYSSTAAQELAPSEAEVPPASYPTLHNPLKPSKNKKTLTKQPTLFSAFSWVSRPSQTKQASPSEDATCTAPDE